MIFQQILVLALAQAGLVGVEFVLVFGYLHWRACLHQLLFILLFILQYF